MTETLIAVAEDELVGLLAAVYAAHRPVPGENPEARAVLARQPETVAASASPSAELVQP